MEADHSDILGHPTLPVSRAQDPSLFSFSFTKSAFLLATLLGLYVLGVRIWSHVLLWRERSYKLATRRRHGIPDSDRRPFNVAYAAAVQSREENEARRAKPKPVQQPASIPDRSSALPEQNTRYRTGAQQHATDPARMQSVSALVPGAYTSGYLPSSSRIGNDITNSPASSPNPLTDPHQRRSLVPQPSNVGVTQRPTLQRQTSRKYLNLSGHKRGFDEQEFDEAEPAKKTRVEGDELIDGDEDAEWQDQNGIIPKRVSKRFLGDEEEEIDDDLGHSKKSRGKRARKFSLEKSLHEDERMEVDEEDDDVPELSSIVRGKKRDRAEAGSTFGGDDDYSVLEHEEGAKVRRRKRQTVSKRKSDAGSLSRGKKRDRDIEIGSDDDNEHEALLKSSRKKRGKRHSHANTPDEDQRSTSDVSMDESLASTRSRARRIGDEWESNGVKYKIGPNGQRLRQALVKEARHKFVMPVDSIHPDRDANLEVFVESWLTEEEYQDARESHLLAWQDSPRRSISPEKLPLDVSAPVPTPPVGKNLLWASTSTTPTASPVSRSPDETPVTALPRPRNYRHSIASHVGLRISPFNQPQTALTKRIASASRAPPLYQSISASPGLSDSTNGSPRGAYRTFSKLEKQELEAKGISRIREANRKKQAEKEAKLKEEKDKADREKAEKERIERERVEREKAEKERIEKERKAKEEAAAAATAATVPTIMVTKPTETQLETKTAAPGLFTFPSSSSADASKPAASAPNPLFASPGAALTSTPSATTSPLFSAPPPKPDAAKPSTAFPAPVQTSAGPTFAFGKTSPQQAEPAPKTFQFQQPTIPASQTKPPLFAQPEQKAGAPSLLSRVGEPEKPASSPFTFAKPSGAPSFFNNKPATAPQAASSSSALPSTTTASPPGPLKFNFGATTKPTTAPVMSSSSLSGALGDPSSTKTGSAFGVKPPTTTEEKKDAPAPPKFNFGYTANAAGAGSSSQQTTNSTSSSQPTNLSSQQTTTDAPKSAFGNTGFTGGNLFANTPASTSAPTPFGAPSNVAGLGSTETKDAPKSVFSTFGNTTTAPSFGASPASQGATETKEAPKSAFGMFGNTPAFGATSPTETKEAPKSGFTSFGNTTSAFGGPAASGTTPSAFGNTAGSSAFAGSSTTTTPAFGSAATTSAFGSAATTPAFGSAAPTPAFGSTTATPAFGSTTTPNVFGSGATSPFSTTPASPAKDKPAEPSKLFSFGGAGMSTNNAAPATPTAEAPKSMFGSITTSAPSNPFSFGSNTSTTPQSSPFGSASTFGSKPGAAGPAAFGFGQTNPAATNGTSSTPSAFSSTFGNPPSSGQQQQ